MCVVCCTIKTAGGHDGAFHVWLWFVFVIYPDGHGELGLSSSRLMSLPCFNKGERLDFFLTSCFSGWMAIHDQKGKGSSEVL